MYVWMDIIYPDPSSKQYAGYHKNIYLCARCTSLDELKSLAQVIITEFVYSESQKQNSLWRDALFLGPYPNHTNLIHIGFTLCTTPVWYQEILQYYTDDSSTIVRPLPVQFCLNYGAVNC
jgi:hypothetical protein